MLTLFSLFSVNLLAHFCILNSVSTLRTSSLRLLWQVGSTLPCHLDKLQLLLNCKNFLDWGLGETHAKASLLILNLNLTSLYSVFRLALVSTQAHCSISTHVWMPERRIKFELKLAFRKCIRECQLSSQTQSSPRTAERSTN